MYLIEKTLDDYEKENLDLKKKLKLLEIKYELLKEKYNYRDNGIWKRRTMV